MAKIQVAAVVELLDLIRGLFGKQPRVKKVQQILGQDVEAYLSGCEKLQEAADAGEALGPLTMDEVRAISRGDDALVKLAEKLKKALD